jgi:uncharacterized repeat protein (TIGR01451 family)
MKQEGRPKKTIWNQTVVSFSTDRYRGHAYSNVVQTFVVGPKLILEKSANEAAPSLGSVITYRLKLSNLGDREAEAILFDAPPQGTELLAGSLRVGDLPSPNGDLREGISFPSLQPGSSVEVSFMVIVKQLPGSGAGSGSSGITNQARVIYRFIAPDGRIASGEILSNRVTLLPRQPAVRVLKKVSSIHSFRGDLLTYTIEIINDGNYSMNRIVLKDILPDGIQWLQGSVNIQGSFHPRANPAKGIELGSLDAGATLTIAFTATVTALITASSEPQRITNQARVTYRHKDEHQAVFSNPVSVHVWNGEVRIRKRVNAEEAAVGSQLRYSFEIENRGNLPAVPKLFDLLPKGTIYVWDSLETDRKPSLRGHPSKGVVLQPLQPGDRTVVTFLATVTDASEVISNSASVETTYRLPDGRTMTDLVRSNVVHTHVIRPVLYLNLAVQPVVAEPCMPVTVRATLTNRGNTAADVMVYDLIPQDTTWIPGSLRISGVRQSYTALVDGVSVGRVAPGDDIEIIYQVAVSCHPARDTIEIRLSAAYRYLVGDVTYESLIYSNPARILIGYHEE